MGQSAQTSVLSILIAVLATFPGCGSEPPDTDRRCAVSHPACVEKLRASSKPRSSPDLVHTLMTQMDKDEPFSMTSVVEYPAPQSHLGRILASVDYYEPCLKVFLEDGTGEQQYLALSIVDYAGRLHWVSLDERVLYHLESYIRAARPTVGGPRVIQMKHHIDRLKSNRLVSHPVLLRVFDNPEQFIQRFSFVTDVRDLRELVEMVLQELS